MVKKDVKNKKKSKTNKLVEDKKIEEKVEDKEIKEEKIEEKKSKLTKKQKQNKQVIWLIILMVSIILIVILVPFITKNYINKFVYLNLDFQKTKLGELIFYSTRVPITSQEGKIVNEYTMNFRNNPKRLEKINFIPFENDVDYVYFKKDEVVYISFNPKMQVCEDNAVALIPFTGFLRDFAKQDVGSAISNKTYANINNMTYATCETAGEKNTVIYINSGEETKIEKTSRTCYELTYADCEITKVTERFELLILEKYMSYFVRKDDSIFDMFG